MPTILIAEHDRTTLAEISKLVRGAGHKVLTARSISQAEAMLAVSRPALLIVDVRLAGENGLQLLLPSRLTHPRMAAIVTSEFADEFLENEARQYGASAYFVKPIAADTLLTRISETLAGIGRPRRWARAPIDPPMEGYINGRRCDVVDVSAGGLRVELLEQEGQPLPSRFEMTLPALSAALDVELVWTGRVSGSGRVSAGVTLAPAPVEATRAWREKIHNLQPSPLSPA